MTRPPPAFETWVIRRMREAGQAFNPETVCEYTGLPLYKFPLEYAPGKPEKMAYWRSDGNLIAVRDLTTQENAWLFANPARYSGEREKFRAWLSKLKP